MHLEPLPCWLPVLWTPGLVSRLLSGLLWSVLTLLCTAHWELLDSTLTCCPHARLALLTVLLCPGAEVQGLAHTSQFESLQAFGAG